MPAKPLTPEQLEDAARLSALFKEWQRARKDARQPSSQSDAAHELGFGQSAFSQYLRGDIPLNINAAVKFSKLLGRKVEEFSPALARKFADFASDADFVILDEAHRATAVQKHPRGKEKERAKPQIFIPNNIPDYVLSAIEAVLAAHHNESPREVFDGVTALLGAAVSPHTGSSEKTKDETATKRAPTSRLTDEANRAKEATKSHLATRSGSARGKENEGERQPRRHKGH